MASPAKFRLERVRALREQLEGRSQEELAASLDSHMKVEAELALAVSAAEEARRSHAATGARGAQGSDLASAHAYYARMDLERKNRIFEVERANQEVEQRRRELQHAARERQVLEQLKDNHVIAANKEALRIEGDLLDEIGISRHRRRGGSR